MWLDELKASRLIVLSFGVEMTPESRSFVVKCSLVSILDVRRYLLRSLEITMLNSVSLRGLKHVLMVQDKTTASPERSIVSGQEKE